MNEADDDVRIMPESASSFFHEERAEECEPADTEEYVPTEQVRRLSVIDEN